MKPWEKLESMNPSRHYPAPRSPHRPVMIVVFAITVILVAAHASADDGCLLYPERLLGPIQLDAESFYLVEPTSSPSGSSANPIARAGRLGSDTDPHRSARPVYASVAAAMANFDADVAADGWRADVMIFDDRNRPLRLDRGHAWFLLETRLSASPIRWSMPLRFDDQGVASFRLPLPWSVAESISSNVYSGRSLGDSASWGGGSGSERFRHRHFAVDALESRLLGWPEDRGFGPDRLTVRVSTRAAGVLSATTFMHVDAAAFLDTHAASR